MDGLAPLTLDPAPVQADNATRPQTPTRLLCLALIWVVGAVVAGIAAAFVAGLTIGVHNGLTLRDPARAWKLGPAAYGLICIGVTDVMLLLAAWRRAKVVGRGDVMAGLGGGPIKRPRLLAALAIIGAAVVFGWMVLLSAWLKPSDHMGITALLRDTQAAGPIMQGAMVLCMVVLSPIWEELFFRGWLWTGLRQHWRPMPVMLATSLPWLMLHLTDGLVRPLFLIPAAITFSLARQYCGGVRASLTLHMLNNLIAIVIVTLAVPAGHP
jgi:membrane protease YdiL (CAAX protease family)